MSKKTVSMLMFAARFGGAEKIMTEIANEISRKVDLELVLVKEKGEYLDKVNNDVDVVNLNAKRSITAIPKLVSYLQKVEPVTIISASRVVNRIAPLAKKFAKSNAKLVLTEHVTTKEFAMREFKHYINKYLMKITYSFADEIVCVSKGVRNDLVSNIGVEKDKTKVIYNPVVDKKMIDKSRKKVEHKWFEKDNIKVILSAGRLEYNKDFSSLIEAASIVRREMDVRLLILGEGSERDSLEEKVKQKGLEKYVSMPGYTDNPYKYMSKADVFAFSSWGREGLPTVLIEALACNCPIVSTNCPTGPAEILGNGEWGTLVPTEDPEELANALVQVLREDRKNNLRQRADDFRKEKSIDQYLEML
jgi:glycosyltransferase involved in cell wall biosynthesis